MTNFYREQIQNDFLTNSVGGLVIQKTNGDLYKRITILKCLDNVCYIDCMFINQHKKGREVSELAIRSTTFDVAFGFL